MAKIAILGCGYVGSALAQVLQKEGHQVRGLVRSEESVQRLQAQGIVGGALDLVSGDYPLNENFDAVVFAASSGGGGLEAYRAIYETAVGRAVRWAEQQGVTKFIFTSSTSVYPQDDGQVVDEESATGGTEYAQILLAGERQVRESKLPLRAVLRLGGLYGPGRNYLAEQLKRGECTIGGRVDHFINYLHQQDAVSALRLLLQSERRGSFLYNVTDGHPVTKMEMARHVAQRLGIAEIHFETEGKAGPRAQKQGRAAVNRQVLGTKFRRDFGWTPIFPSFFEGFSP